MTGNDICAVIALFVPFDCSVVFCALITSNVEGGIALIDAFVLFPPVVADTVAVILDEDEAEEVFAFALLAAPFRLAFFVEDFTLKLLPVRQ